jgi:hypothetical protein
VPISSALKLIISDPSIHGRWLNSLSYLEYRGFRKIVKSQSSDEIDLEVLSHTAEEARHAVLFKKMALKIGGAQLSHYREQTMLAAPALKKYFYELDHGSDRILAAIGDPGHNKAVYLIVTLLIEERAVEVYEIYQRELNQSGLALSLSPILKDESKHLADVIAGIRNDVPGFTHAEEQLRKLELNCFKNVWLAIEHELGITPDSDLTLA